MDASVILTLCFEDEDNAHGQRVLDAAEAGMNLIVPAVWPLEVSNGLMMAERRGRLKKRCIGAFPDAAQGSAYNARSAEPPLYDGNDLAAGPRSQAHRIRRSVFGVGDPPRIAAGVKRSPFGGSVHSRRRRGALARLSHLKGFRVDKPNGMSKGYAKVFTTKRG